LFGGKGLLALNRRGNINDFGERFDWRVVADG
jgi:hypothetical protein